MRTAELIKQTQADNEKGSIRFGVFRGHKVVKVILVRTRDHGKSKDYTLATLDGKKFGLSSLTISLFDTEKEACGHLLERIEEKTTEIKKDLLTIEFDKLRLKERIKGL